MACIREPDSRVYYYHMVDNERRKSITYSWKKKKKEAKAHEATKRPRKTSWEKCKRLRKSRLKRRYKYPSMFVCSLSLSDQKYEAILFSRTAKRCRHNMCVIQCALGVATAAATVTVWAQDFYFRRNTVVSRAWFNVLADDAANGDGETFAGRKANMASFFSLSNSHTLRDAPRSRRKNFQSEFMDGNENNTHAVVPLIRADDAKLFSYIHYIYVPCSRVLFDIVHLHVDTDRPTDRPSARATCTWDIKMRNGVTHNAKNDVDAELNEIGIY